MPDYWFWWMLTGACVVWYSTVTIYVAIKGVTDIKTMLRHLQGDVHSVSSQEPDSDTAELVREAGEP